MTTALALLPDFALILVGFALRRAMHLGDHFWAGLEKLVYFVLFPALLFGALVRNPIDWSAAGPLVAVGGMSMGVGMILGGAGRWLFPAVAPMSYASQFQCAFRFNSYIGFAVAGSLHGMAGIAAMGLMTGGLVPLANLAAVWMLARQGRLGLWRELSRNPLVLATLAGLLWSSAGWPFPTSGMQLLTRLADAAIALGLLAVGAALKLRGVVEPGSRGLAAWLMAAKLFVMPATALALAHGLGLRGVHFDIAVVFAALPTASSAYILAQRMGGDGARVAWLISATTLAAMVTLPAWMGLATSLR